MTQLLQTAIEEALKQSPAMQDSIAAAILGQINQAREQPRALGLARGHGQVGEDFNDPLPEDELKLWYERGQTDPLNG